MIARSEAEVVLFNQLDQEMQWPDEQGINSFTKFGLYCLR